ncbi:MAG: hypothetical protein K2O18_05940 [Oscillospiraceae bacterium]|nr:hypothetical protein [Oscillospiraceae bacterium]
MNIKFILPLQPHGGILLYAACWSKKTAALISQNRRLVPEFGHENKSAQQRFFSFLPLGR